MNNHRPINNQIKEAILISSKSILRAAKKGHIHQPKEQGGKYSRMLKAHLTGCREGEDSSSVFYNMKKEDKKLSFFKIGEKDKYKLELVSEDFLEKQNGLTIVAAPETKELDFSELHSSKVQGWSYQALTVMSVPNKVIIADMGKLTGFHDDLACWLWGPGFENPQPGKFFEEANSSTLLSVKGRLCDNFEGDFNMKVLATDTRSKDRKSRIATDINNLVFSEAKRGYEFAVNGNSKIEEPAHPDFADLSESNGIDQTIAAALKWANDFANSSKDMLGYTYTFIKDKQVIGMDMFLLIKKY